eukprot:CAMPEP_0184400712 /NCGR_PEP_ID=MMETSP0007-20130409/75915_1 /TAXON_ID=97485 /ORGANISM="Prymnesium parvum, Strain Texoma1" /LENGTH=164 /DNA_ID=CAMNT_0026755763 /DNA_START=398 /DNA_END=889 /DNA_ORIENTATION=-
MKESTPASAAAPQLPSETLEEMTKRIEAEELTKLRAEEEARIRQQVRDRLRSNEALARRPRPTTSEAEQVEVSTEHHPRVRQDEWHPFLPDQAKTITINIYTLSYMKAFWTKCRNFGERFYEWRASSACVLFGDPLLSDTAKYAERPQEGSDSDNEETKRMRVA